MKNPAPPMTQTRAAAAQTVTVCSCGFSLRVFSSRGGCGAHGRAVHPRSCNMRRCRLPCPGSVRLSFHLYFRPGCRNQPDYVLNPDLNPARDHNPDPDRNRGQNGNSGFHPDNHHPGHHTDNNPDHCPDRRSGNRICLRNLFCSHPDFRPPAGFSFRCCRHTGLPERFHLYNRHRSQSPPGYTRCLIRLWSPAGRRCNLLPRCYNVLFRCFLIKSFKSVRILFLPVPGVAAHILDILLCLPAEHL